MQFQRTNAFLLPPLAWLVPGWRQAFATDHFRAASGYRGPLYLVLTERDAVVLIRNGPEDVPDAIDVVSRFSLRGQINVATATGAVRPASAHEQAEALRRLAQGEAVVKLEQVWVAGSLGFCVHDEPWLVSLFQLSEDGCTAAVSSTEAERINPLSEE